MTTFNTHAASSPFTQLTFMFPEAETKVATTTEVRDTSLHTLPRKIDEHDSRRQQSQDSLKATTIPIGVKAPERKPSPFSGAQRRNKTEHISDLLLVVLDRYGIDPNEFMAGLE